MCAYFIYKMFIYEVLIEEMLLDENPTIQAVAIVGIPLFAIIGLFFFLLDIIMTPIYLMIGAVSLVIVLIKKIF